VTPPVRLSGALTNADYRAAGAPRGAAGTVRINFRVRRDGGVDRCTVTGSSGYGMFDEATCRLIQQRFRFRPATGVDGQPIDWGIRTEYTWSPR
jgi:protein TonB